MTRSAAPETPGDPAGLTGAERMLLGTLLLAALALRLVALGWGLPAFTEEATPYRKAAEFWGATSVRWTLDPRFYNYPSLTFYLQFVWLGLTGLAGALAGAWSGLSGFRTALSEPAPALVMAARGLDVLLGALTLVPVYRLARSMAGGAGGVAMAAGATAAMILAVSPVHVAESRVIGTDVPMALAVAAALWCLERGTRPGGGGAWQRGAVLAGLAASCKYPGALVVLPFLVAAARRPAEAARLGLLAAAAFALTSPFVLLNLPTAWQAMAFERWHMATGHFRSVNEAGYLFYARDLLPRALGWPALLLGLLGMAAAVRGGTGARLVAGFALAGFLLLGSWRVAFDRYVLLIVPAWCALAGLGLATAIDWVRGRAALRAPGRSVFETARWGPAALVLLIALVALPSALVSLREAPRRGRPTTRDAAGAWARGHLPANSLVAVERYSIESLADSLALLVIPFDSVDPHRYDPAYSLPYYAPFEWIVLSSALYDRYLSRIAEFPAQARFYDGVARDFGLVAEFRPERGLVGPTIRIFRRPPGDTPMDFRGIDAAYYAGVTERGAMASFLASLAGVLARGGRADLALAAAEQAVILAPNDIKALTNLAVLRGERGEYLAALNTYQRGLALAPDEPRLHYNLGRLYETRQLWNEAAAAYGRAVGVSPRMVEAWWGLYAAQIHLDDRAGARGSLERIIGILPPGPRASDVRALLQTLGEPAG